MVDRIGVARKWIQHQGDHVREHFDICSSKRVKAVSEGATETEWRHWGKFARSREL